MTAFVDSCVETVAASAVQVARRARGRPRARQLLDALAGKKNILLTTHLHPDPDALGSALALRSLLEQKLDGKPQFTISVKGHIGGGVNDAFVMLDTQPQFAFSPLPNGVKPTAVIDHHRTGRGRRVDCAFCDVRTDAG